MARALRSQTMPLERAYALLENFDRGEQEGLLRSADTALSATSGTLGDIEQQIQSAAAAVHEGDLLAAVDACKSAFARFGPAVKLVSVVTAAFGTRRAPEGEAMQWEDAREWLRDFNAEDVQKVGAGLTTASEGLAEGVEKIGTAISALSKVDLLEVADAGKVAAEELRKLQAVTALIGRITAASYQGSADVDDHYREFEHLLKHDYQHLALEDDYPAEAEAFATLRGIQERMGEIRLAPRISKRNLCAVAGGFSSGKSSFLNALIGGTEHLLPTRITPTTSISTYIFNVKDADQSINAFNHHGGAVEVEPKMLRQMTHDFQREHGIELKRLVDRVSIYTPRLEAYPNVALVDTPGYTNPDEADSATSDEEVALRAVEQSRFLIWLVDCEKGTLPEQDVKLIKKFMGGRKVYLVLNKADKKPEDERGGILKHVVEAAQEHEIPFVGIALYSAHNNEWYGCEGRPFDEFLKVVNDAKSEAMGALEEEVRDVFAGYDKYGREEQKRLADLSGLLDRVSMHVGYDQSPSPEESVDQDRTGSVAQSLASHRRALNTAIGNQKKWLEEAAGLQGKFLRTVQGFIESVEAMHDKEGTT